MGCLTKKAATSCACARALRILAGAIAPATAPRCPLSSRGPKAPGQRPPRPWRALLARRVGRWPAFLPDLPVYRAASSAGGGNAGRVSRFRPKAQSLSPDREYLPGIQAVEVFFSTLSDLHSHSRCDFGLSHQLNRCDAAWQGQRWRSGRVTCLSLLNDRRHKREIGMTLPFTGQGLPITVARP